MLIKEYHKNMKLIFGLIIIANLLIPVQSLAASNTISSSPNLKNEMGKIMPPDNIDTLTSLFGDDHKYSVFYKDDGQAIVLFLNTVYNSDDQPLDQIELRSKKTISTPSAFQLIRETCSRYRNDNIGKCLIFEEQQDYFQFYSDKITYHKSETSLNGDKIIVKLSKPIAPNKSGSFILAYTLNDVVKNRLGGSSEYEFTTLTTEKPIQNVSIGINSQTQKMFRGVPYSGEIIPRNDVYVYSSAQKSGSAKFSSTQFDQIIYSIGFGTVTKNASFMNPGESFTYNGIYANNFLALYSHEITIGTLFILLIVSLIIGIIIFIVKKNRSKQEMSEKKDSILQNKSITNLLIYTATSFGFSLTIAIFLLVTYFIKIWIDEQIYANISLNNFAVFLLNIKATMAVSLLYFGPLGYVLFKRGIKHLVVFWIIFTAWLLVMAFMTIIIFSLIPLNKYGYNMEPIMQPSMQPMPYPIFKDASNADLSAEISPEMTIEAVD